MDRLSSAEGFNFLIVPRLGREDVEVACTLV